MNYGYSNQFSRRPPTSDGFGGVASMEDSPYFSVAQAMGGGPDGRQIMKFLQDQGLIAKDSAFGKMVANGGNMDWSKMFGSASSSVSSAVGSSFAAETAAADAAAMASEAAAGASGMAAGGSM